MFCLTLEENRFLVITQPVALLLLLNNADLKRGWKLIPAKKRRIRA